VRADILDHIAREANVLLAYKKMGLSKKCQLQTQGPWVKVRRVTWTTPSTARAASSPPALT